MIKKIESNYEIIPLEWDTKEFNIKSCKVILKNAISKKEVIEIENYIKENKYTFVTIQNINNNDINNYELSNLHELVLADVNIQFEKVVEKRFSDKRVVIENNKQIDNEILKIAKEAFTYSRFYNEPKLPDNKYNIYFNWTKNSFEKDDKYFAIYEENGIKGFILFSIDDIKNSMTIELVAVASDAQHQGIGSILLNTIEDFAYKNEIKVLNVGTQLNNIKAQNFYIKYGFKHKNVTSIYHWWN